MSTATATRPQFEIRFESLFPPGRGLVFPCDEQGRVDLDSLTERGRRNYLDALDQLGCDYATPRVIERASPRNQ